MQATPTPTRPAACLPAQEAADGERYQLRLALLCSHAGHNDSATFDALLALTADGAEVRAGWCGHGAARCGGL